MNEDKKKSKDVKKSNIPAKAPKSLANLLSDEGKAMVCTEGRMPINPIDMIESDEELMEEGMHAGSMYGGSLYTIISSLARTDLPPEKRFVRIMQGLKPMVGMGLGALEAYRLCNEVESAVLMEAGVSRGGQAIYRPVIREDNEKSAQKLEDRIVQIIEERISPEKIAQLVEERIKAEKKAKE